MHKLALIGSAVGGLLLAFPAFAQLSADSYTWSAEVHLKEGGIERTTLIDARQNGEFRNVKMECAVVDKAFRPRHVQRFTGTARWESGLMLGTANNEMKFTIGNRNDGDLAVITSGDFCASGKGYLGSGDASVSQDRVKPSVSAKQVANNLPPAATTADSGWSTWTHNGSTMAINERTGRIVYEEPKASIAGTVGKGTVLFEGKFTGKQVSGTAYVFKKGCAPAPYQISGTMESNPRGFGSRIVMTGAAPKRDKASCMVLGTGAAHSKLIFEEAGDI